MAGSHRAQRSIVRNCKFQPIARVVQHDEAKAIVAKVIRDGEGGIAALKAKAQELRIRLADSEFERDLYDHNADYIDRFAAVLDGLALPDAQRLPPGNVQSTKIKGVKVTLDLQFRLRRLTKTNKVRVGGGMLRYAKGKPLAPTVAEWQSAFLFGYLNSSPPEEGATAEQKLCLTVDAYSGQAFGAPGDSASRYKNMSAVCETIAEWWPNIPPPPNAIL